MPGRPGHISPCFVMQDRFSCTVCERTESALDAALNASLYLEAGIHHCTREQHELSVKLWKAKKLTDEVFAVLWEAIDNG